MRITVATKVALDVLRTHRERHIIEYKEQYKGWQDAMQKYGESLKTWAANQAKPTDRPQEPQKPFDNLEEYNALIKKLEHHTLEGIQLEDHEFDQIINDKFRWTRGFMLNSATYASASLSADRIAGRHDEDDNF